MLDYSITTVTPPAVEPVTLADAKKQANVVATDDDDYLTALISVARELVETDTGRALITQTLRYRCHRWPVVGVDLPRPPLQSVTAVTYLDGDDTEQTLATDQYSVDTDRSPGVVWWDADAILPTLSDQKNAVRITYVAGYGADAEDVPARAKQAILLLVGHWYRVRESVGQVGDEIALTYQRLVRSLKLGAYP